MTEKIIASGFGGQGVILIGQIISYTALKAGYNTTWIPSYGPEMRGGTANCSFVVSSEEIGSPIVNEPTVLICMNQPSLEKFGHLVKPGGLIFYNTPMVQDTLNRKDIEMIPVPTGEIAAALGSQKLINMVAVGAFMSKRAFLDLDSVIDSLADKIGRKQDLLDLNRKAILAGMDHCAKNAA